MRDHVIRHGKIFLRRQAVQIGIFLFAVLVFLLYCMIHEQASQVSRTYSSVLSQPVVTNVKN